MGVFQRLNLVYPRGIILFSQLLVLSVFFISPIGISTALGQPYPFNIPFVQKETSFYQFDPLTRQVTLRMDYAKYEIYNASDWNNKEKDKEVYEIDLVFTRYPAELNKWITNYSFLLKKRLETLFQLDPTLKNSDIKWNMVLQTKCKTAAEAKEMFHGFVIKYTPVHYRLPKLLPGEKEAMTYVLDIIYGKKPMADSLVFNAFANHPEWSDMLVVLDWTGSMYPYSAQVVRWLKLNINQDKIRHFILFNDGNDNLNNDPNRKKEIGFTGGVYAADPSNLDQIIAVMCKAMKAGAGGEPEENDLEALVKGLKHFGSSKDIVLVADNASPVRDYILLSKINKPIHVVLVGKKEEPLCMDYVNIAAVTGGSLVTIEDEIRFDKQVLSKKELTINGQILINTNGKLSTKVVKKP